jgi:hypothetical protein
MLFPEEYVHLRDILNVHLRDTERNIYFFIYAFSKILFLVFLKSMINIKISY